MPQYRLPSNSPDRAFLTSDNEYNQKMLFFLILLALLCASLQHLKTALESSVVEFCNGTNVIRNGLNLMSVIMLVSLSVFFFNFNKPFNRPNLENISRNVVKLNQTHVLYDSYVQFCLYMLYFYF